MSRQKQKMELTENSPRKDDAGSWKVSQMQGEDKGRCSAPLDLCRRSGEGGGNYKTYEKIRTPTRTQAESKNTTGQKKQYEVEESKSRGGI